MNNGFVPKFDERYFFVDADGSLAEDVCLCCPVDVRRVAFGNSFATREDAVAAAERVEKALRMLNENHP